jgi:hypothetical protein
MEYFRERDNKPLGFMKQIISVTINMCFKGRPCTGDSQPADCKCINNKNHKSIFCQTTNIELLCICLYYYVCCSFNKLS